MSINLQEAREALGEFADRKIRFRDQVRFLTGERKTLIVNMETRFNMFLSNEVLDIFRGAESEDYTYIQLAEAVHEDDRDYICDVVKELVNHYLVEGSVPPFDSKWVEITLDITGRCNLRCKHCCVSAGESIKGEDLSTEELKSVLDKIIAFDPKKISLSGGEPMIRKDFEEIVTYIHERYSGPLELMTNGTLITRETAQFIGKNFASVSVSLDGVDEATCSIIRGAGTFDACMKGIRILKEETSCELSISMVVCQENEKYVKDFHAMVRELGAHPIARTLSPSERLSRNEDSIHFPIPEKPLSGEALAKYLEEYKERKMHKKPPETFSCQAARRQFEIDYVGDIYPCPALMDDEFLMGNIRRIDDFSRFILEKEYENSDGYKNFRKYLPYEIERCKDCNKNLLCGSCVAMMRDEMKMGTLFDHCEENKCIFDLYWED